MERLSGGPPLHFLTLLILTLQGSRCELLIQAAGPTQVTKSAGSTVTLDFVFRGAADPTITWFMGDLPVATWTIGSSSVADVPEDKRDVLKVELNGTLTFVDVSPDYSGSYRVVLTKSGLDTTSLNFTLRVFVPTSGVQRSGDAHEILQNVTLWSRPVSVIEGAEQFTLQYSILEGTVERQWWFFSGTEVETDSHYSVKQDSLVVLRPTRRDSGQYRVSLTNPFGSIAAYKNITVLYGPDEPQLKVSPAKEFYASGESLNLSCQGDGFPRPTAEWTFEGRTLPEAHEGLLTLTNVQTSQGGIYVCTLRNELTGVRQQNYLTLDIYERPSGALSCSVQSENTSLQYLCWWPGGKPTAVLSFPALNSSSSGREHFSLTVAASEELNSKTVTCMAEHPLLQRECNITAGSPMKFLPIVRTTVDSEGKIVVSIRCVSEALPGAVVSWLVSGDAVSSGAMYHISSDTTEFEIRDHNVSALQQNYTCTCRNPLGSQSRQVQLQGPTISDSGLFPNPDGTVVTLTWEVPPTSIVTGFDIQMKGPDLLSESRLGTQTKVASKAYRTIQQKPGSARSADISVLDPKSTYRFRVIPKALMTEGQPTGALRIGPGGLSGPAIAGIAAGIPCSLLFLLLLCGLIYLCVFCSKNRSRQTRYPVSRAVEKAVTTQAETTPHHLLTGGLKTPPDYNRLHQAPSERSVTLPTFVPPPPQPVRVATTV